MCYRHSILLVSKAGRGPVKQDACHALSGIGAAQARHHIIATSLNLFKSRMFMEVLSLSYVLDIWSSPVVSGSSAPDNMGPAAIPRCRQHSPWHCTCQTNPDLDRNVPSVSFKLRAAIKVTWCRQFWVPSSTCSSSGPIPCPH